MGFRFGSKEVRKKVAFLIAGLLVLALATLFLVRTLSQPVFIDESKEVTYDDFSFGVSNLQAVRNVGRVQAPKGMMFYLFDAQVTNHALRVDYDFKPQTFQLYGPGNTRLQRAPAAQAALDSILGTPQLSEVSIAPQGQSATRRVAFMGPAGLETVSVAIGGTDWLGDFLDAVFGGNIHIRIPVRR